MQIQVNCKELVFLPLPLLRFLALPLRLGFIPGKKWCQPIELRANAHVSGTS